MFVVFDLDGTLADITHRVQFVREGRKDWDAFFKACPDDTPITPVINTLLALEAAGHQIEIWSGRSDVVRKETEVWLEKHIRPNLGVAHMRADGDFTPDDKLKEQWLLNAPYKPDLIFDDRQKVVEMWRRHDIRVAQVAKGDF